MRRLALFALPVLALLGACNEAGQPAGQETTPVDENAAPVTATPGTSPTLEATSRPEAAGATTPATSAAAGGDSCGAAKAQQYRNALPSRDIRTAIRDSVGHDRIRMIEPGTVVTMEYSAERLNLEIGADGRIKAIRCG